MHSYFFVKKGLEGSSYFGLNVEIIAVKPSSSTMDSGRMSVTIMFKMLSENSGACSLEHEVAVHTYLSIRSCDDLLKRR